APPGCKFIDPQHPGNVCPADFGQVRHTYNRNDMSTVADDVASEFEYAAPASPSSMLGLVSTEARRVLLPDGSLGSYLSYAEHRYDGLPVGQVTLGNDTETAQFDAAAPSSTRPVGALLGVKTASTYSTQCPGRKATVTDPTGAVATTEWDSTCSFLVAMQNAAGHTTRTSYYGVDGFTPSTVPRSGAYGTFSLKGRYGVIAETVDAND